MAGVGDFYGPGEVFTHGARVGVWNEGGFIAPPSIEPVEDNVTAEAALQAEGSQFDITGLDAPLNADPGQSIDVTASIESVGELGDTQTVEFVFGGSVVANESVNLSAFTLAGGLDSTTVTFQDIPLPDTEDYFEHGVFTEDDGATAPLAVGLQFKNLTVTQSGDAQGELTTDLLQESLLPRFGIPTVVDAANVTDSVITETDVFLFHDLGDAAPDIIPAVEDDPLTNAVYLEQWTSSNAIASRVDVLNDPEEVVTEFNDAPPVEFTIEQDHPIFDGVGSSGDVVPIHSGGDADFVWFENASGETLATVDDQNATDESFGPSVSVDPDSGAVLLSSIATVTSFAGDITPADFTAEASQILANAVEFAEPGELEEPFFQVSDLSAPAEAGAGATINVSATVTNLGNQTDTQTVEFVFNGSVAANATVELNASEQTTVEFNGIPLPDQTGTFTHGVFTDNDSQTAEILVGDFTTVTVVESGETFGEGVESLLAGNIPDNFNTQIVNADDVTDSVVDNTDIFVFNDLNVTAGSASENVRQRSDSPFASTSGVTGNGLNADTAELITTVEADITTGAVYLDQWGSDSDGIVDRSSVVGDPAETFQSFQGSFPVEYAIQQDHPLFDGVGGSGDTVEIHGGGFSPDISWFSGASGETLAEVQAGSEGGPAATVDPDTGSVLLSSLGVTGFVGPEEYTTEAGQILGNGVEVAQPPELSGAFFDVTGLSAPAQAETGATINVSATVTNVGNETGTQTVEFVFNGSVAATVSGVELDPGSETVVEFTDVPLPGEGGVFEHGVQTANDSQFATITVGSPDVELVELDQPDELTPGEDIITEITLTNNGTAPYEGEVLHATNLNDTAPDSGTIAIPANVTAFTLEPGENVTFTDNLGTFTEINGALDTNFGPGDEVETGYQRGQNLAAAFEPGGGATIEEIYSADISVVAPGPPNVTMANLSIAGQGEDATVVAGSYDVTAEMSHTGGAGGDVPMELTIGNETLSKNVTLEADQTVTVTFENATSGLEPGIYNVSMAGSTDAVSGSLTLSVDVGGSQEPAADTTGDGNLNDIDGNSEFNIFDVQSLFDELDSPVLQDNPGLFDFAGINENRVSIFDVQALFVELNS